MICASHALGFCSVLSLVFCQACAVWTYPNHQGEAIADRAWSMAGDESRIVVGEEDRLPAHIREDLVALNAALRGLPFSIEQMAINTSPNGKVVLARKANCWGEPEPQPPLGVWIWPDWRDAGTSIHIPQFSRARFVSSHHVMLWQHKRSDRGRLQFDARLLDIRSPDRRFNWFMRLERGSQARLRVAENGRWAGATRDGKLYVGLLDADDEDSLLHGTEVETEEPVENVLLLHNGSLLVVELESGLLVTRTADGSRRLDSIGGYDSTDTRGCSLGSDSFIAWSKREGRSFFFTASPDGKLHVHPQTLAHLRPYSYAPSGKYVIAYKHLLSPGAIKSLVRRTPKADASEPIPPLPKPSSRVRGFLTGWLSWQ